MSDSTCQHHRHYEFMATIFSEFNEAHIENMEGGIHLFQEFYSIKPSKTSLYV